MVISLAYTSNPLQLELDFSSSFPGYQKNIQLLSIIAISGFITSEFNFSITNSSNLKLYLSLAPSRSIIGGPLLNFTLNLSDLFLLQNNIYMPSKSCSIKLSDYYPISSTAKKTADSISSQVSTSQTIAQSSGYASTFLSSSSSLFVQGLMLVEMIFYLKYIDINYPPIVIQMFETKNSNPSFIFQINFVDDPKDKAIVPQLFQHYHVSVYFLNNVGEALCQICAIVFLATCFLWVTPYSVDTNKKQNVFLKVGLFIRDALVWETALFYILMNLQKIIFFISCSWMFPPLNSFNAILNLSFATVIGFVIFLWLGHLLIKIKVCQNFKQSLLQSNEPSKFEENSKEEFDSANNRSSNTVFPDSATRFGMEKNGGLSKTGSLEAKSYKKTNLQLNLDLNYSQDHTMLEMNMPSQQESSSPEKSKNIENKICKKIFESFKKIGRFLFSPKNKEVFLRRYEVLHLEYKSAKSIHKYYAFAYYLRQCLLSVVVVYGCTKPLLVAITINVINLTFVLYTIIANPFCTYYSYIVSVINELITEAALFSGLMIAILDWQQDFSIEKRMNCGWVIIFANTILLYWVIFTGITKPIFYAIYEFYKRKKEINQVHPL